MLDKNLLNKIYLSKGKFIRLMYQHWEYFFVQSLVVIIIIRYRVYITLFLQIILLFLLLVLK